jgi:hypothetical protein
MNAFKVLVHLMYTVFDAMWFTADVKLDVAVVGIKVDENQGQKKIANAGHVPTPITTTSC